ncbi:MAG: hypothetical protein V7673_11070 [Paracoccus sp. (in: a-proteobacteria)]|jgi:hypothetical protein|uniref:hypothetical protein n=1 Tax=Paracoccus sp. TaxID=267 RepID=UPI0030023945|tara:strand:+ start:43 stop:525 length:483 start_codon:yes stop_codon:yes gene_type:complete
MASKELENKALTFACSEFDADKYQAVASSARLREVVLARSKYDAKVFELRFALSNDEAVTPSFSGSSQASDFDATEGLVFGSYCWTARIKLKRRTLISAKAEFVLVYDNLEGADEKYVELYFEKLARFTTYPYFRSFFSLSTSNSGVALPPLPSLTDRMD